MQNTLNLVSEAPQMEFVFFTFVLISLLDEDDLLLF